jgi:RHH-type rel operon transcriptional repressor/antitoxin RelB
MMTIRLPEKMEHRLSELAKETHRTKTYYVKRAIEEFLDDQEDYLLALATWENFEKSGEKPIPFEEILKKYGSENDKH